MLSKASILFAVSALPAVWAQDCSPLHFVFARATTEPPTGVDGASAEEFEAAADAVWSKGYGAAGHSIYTNVTALIPDATGYPVHYPASFGNSPPVGIEDMTSHLTQMSQQCPDQVYALGGHSQGGVVTVQAIPQLPEDVLSRVIAVTMVGSPDCPAEVQDRCKSYCNAGDAICEGGGLGGLLGGIGGDGGGIGGLLGGTGGDSGGPGGLLGGIGGDGGGLGSLLGGIGGNSPSKRSRVYEKRNMFDPRQAPPDCSGPEVEEKGHEAGSGLGAHLAYNEDGYYVRAAACYIFQQFNAASGAPA